MSRSHVKREHLSSKATATRSSKYEEPLSEQSYRVAHRHQLDGHLLVFCNTCNSIEGGGALLRCPSCRNTDLKELGRSLEGAMSQDLQKSKWPVFCKRCQTTVNAEYYLRCVRCHGTQCSALPSSVRVNDPEAHRCEWCMTTHPHISVTLFPCRHILCSKCICKYFPHVIRCGRLQKVLGPATQFYAMPCPVAQCDSIYVEVELMPCMGSILYENLITVLHENLTWVKLMSVPCPDCNREVTVLSSSPRAHCHSCNVFFCRSCKAHWTDSHKCEGVAHICMKPVVQGRPLPPGERYGTTPAFLPASPPQSPSASRRLSGPNTPRSSSSPRTALSNSSHNGNGTTQLNHSPRRSLQITSHPIPKLDLQVVEFGSGVNDNNNNSSSSNSHRQGPSEHHGGTNSIVPSARTPKHYNLVSSLELTNLHSNQNHPPPISPLSKSPRSTSVTPNSSRSPNKHTDRYAAFFERSTRSSRFSSAGSGPALLSPTTPTYQAPQGYDYQPPHREPTLIEKTMQEIKFPKSPRKHDFRADVREKKPCPNCGALCTKPGAFNMIVCKNEKEHCSCRWCWICQRVWSEQCAKSHNSDPSYSQSEELVMD